MTMTVWRLRKGEGRKFFSGHPWVFSNELQKGFEDLDPGTPVELRDHSGNFLARGYGNPHSLIAFRELSRDKSVIDPFALEFIKQKILRAMEFRKKLGFGGLSHRLCFGEADGLPGLIIDVYAIGAGEVYVLQSHTAGGDVLIPKVVEVLDGGMILKNNSAIRKLEGLKEEEPKILRGLESIDFCEVEIKVLSSPSPIQFKVNLLGGQKTGFFLDQASNIQLARAWVLKIFPEGGIKVLDLFSYVGQWGVQLGQGQKNTEIFAIDASESALRFAEQNFVSYKIPHQIFKADIFEKLESFEQQAFDVVVCDPPGLIKGKKNLIAGEQAYFKINTQALRLVKKGGILITCSCSYLLDENKFFEILRKAVLKSNRKVKWIAHGMQSPDHPVLAEFPEGRYLKCWIGVVVE